MSITLIANLIALVGCIIMVLTGLIKSKSKILIAQNVQMGMQGIAHAMLGAYSGMLSCIIGITRNFVTLKRELTLSLKLIFIGAQALLTLLFGNPTFFLNWFPLISNSIYIATLDSKNIIVIKISIMISTACWIIFDFYYQNYSSFAFDVLTVASNLIGICMLLKAKESE